MTVDAELQPLEPGTFTDAAQPDTPSSRRRPRTVALLVVVAMISTQVAIAVWNRDRERSEARQSTLLAAAYAEIVALQSAEATAREEVDAIVGSLGGSQTDDGDEMTRLVYTEHGTRLRLLRTRVDAVGPRTPRHERARAALLALLDRRIEALHFLARHGRFGASVEHDVFPGREASQAATAISRLQPRPARAVDTDVRLDAALDELRRRHPLPSDGDIVDIEPLPFSLVFAGYDGEYRIAAGERTLRRVDWQHRPEPWIYRHDLQVTDHSGGLQVRGAGRLLADSVSRLVPDSDGDGWWAVGGTGSEGDVLLHASGDHEPATPASTQPPSASLFGATGFGLLFTEPDGGVIAWDPASHVATALPYGWAHPVAAAPDALLTRLEDGHLALHRPPDFRPQRVGLRDDIGVAVDVSPDGRAFALVAFIEDEMSAVVVDVADGSVNRLRSADVESRVVWAPDSEHVVVSVRGRPHVVSVDSGTDVEIPLVARILGTG